MDVRRLAHVHGASITDAGSVQSLLEHCAFGKIETIAIPVGDEIPTGLFGGEAPPKGGIGHEHGGRYRVGELRFSLLCECHGHAYELGTYHGQGHQLQLLHDAHVLDANRHFIAAAPAYAIPIGGIERVIALHRMADRPRCHTLHQSYFPVSGNAASLHGLCERGILQATHILRHRDEVYGNHHPGAEQCQQCGADPGGFTASNNAAAFEILWGANVGNHRVLVHGPSPSNVVCAAALLVLGAANHFEHRYRIAKAHASVLHVRDELDAIGRANIRVCCAE
mmetsp:Transcript_35270/g.74482  ORF Transcript_35270/g.74482 Transcript_35270/m.74482 type:complete len:281 (+) Transcript_35270:615-1457(+)